MSEYSIGDLPRSVRRQATASAPQPSRTQGAHLREGYQPPPVRSARSVNHRETLERYIEAGAITLEGRSIYLHATEREDGTMERSPAPYRRIIHHDGRVKVELKDHGRQCKIGAGLVAWRIKTGRYIRRGQVVWHINGDERDYHPENLEVISAADAHSRRALGTAKDRSA